MKSTKLFQIFGIDVRIHYSWWFIFIILSWSLASAFFPQFYPDFDKQTYWFMGIVSAILLFISVLLHELSHSLVAMAKKIKVESITLFFFGGVAGITEEDMKPSSEFQMAIAGPLFSLFLSGVFFLIFKFNGNGIVTAITFYLYQLNFILAIFNLVPGYPLDGGRAFRAILYAYYKDLKKATRIAAASGKFFAMFLIITGVLGIFTGAGGGLWFILIGAFLYFIAGMSYEQVVLREVLSKVKVKDLVENLPSLRPEMKFAEFIKKNLRGGKSIFLIRDDKFSGILDIKRLQSIPKKMHSLLKLKQVALSFSQMKSVSSKSSAYDAFKLLNEQNLEMIPVKDKKNYFGVVTKSAIINRLMLELKFNDSSSEKLSKKSTILKRIKH